ncbi:hypothetical protein TNCV_4897531 [Trichonephila clavipes]|nr:hypothetical protein TNCV_4897531 [Trichonephila clavipes]
MQCLTGQQRVGCSAEGARVTHIQVSEETTQVKGMAALRLFRPVHRAEANRTRVWHLEYTQSGHFCPKHPSNTACANRVQVVKFLSTMVSQALYAKNTTWEWHTESIGLEQRRLSLWQPLAP